MVMCVNKCKRWPRYDHVQYVFGSVSAIVSENIAIGIKAGMRRQQAIAKALSVKDAHIRSTRKPKESWERDGLGTLWDRTTRKKHNVTLQDVPS